MSCPATVILYGRLGGCLSRIVFAMFCYLQPVQYGRTSVISDDRRWSTAFRQWEPCSTSRMPYIDNLRVKKQAGRYTADGGKLRCRTALGRHRVPEQILGEEISNVAKS